MTTKFHDPFSEEIWATTYKDFNDTTIDDTMMRVATFVASAEKNKELRDVWTEKFYDMLSEFKCTSGGRIYANAGTEFGGTTMMNCFVSPRPERDVDSLPGILQDILNQTQTLKAEGGWGQNFSFIRPRGAFIKGIGVETPGAVKYMEIYDKTSDVITAGSGRKSLNKKAKGKIRKGAMMGVMDVWHPDIIEFITAKQQPGRLTKFNVSVNCTDQFMSKVLHVLEIDEELKKDYSNEEKARLQQHREQVDSWDLRFPDTSFDKYDAEWQGDINKWEQAGYPVRVYRTVSATWLWNMIMESTYNRAEPGVLFLDRANYFGPLNYAEHISATNPCFTGDTLVSTSHGLVRIDSLIELTSQIKAHTSYQPIGGTGDGYVSIEKAQFTGVRDVVKIEMSNGMSIRCTPEHKFWTTECEYVEAKNLIGKSLQLTQMPFVTTNKDEDLDMAFVLGWMTGDGWISKNTLGMIFGKEDSDALARVQNILKKWNFNPKPSIDKNGSTTLYICNKSLVEKIRELGFIQCRAGEKRVPLTVFTNTKKYVAEFLNGLFSADGSIVSLSGSDYWVSLCSKSKELLNDVQQLLLMFGITHHSIYDVDKTSTFEYTTVSGEHREYVGGVYHDLRIFGHSIVSFYENITLTITRKQQALELLQDKRFKNKLNCVTVVSVVEDGTEPVYDLTIPVTHNFIAGGFIVHNCGEQTLAPGGVCNLGSINLTQFVKDDGFDLKSIKKYTRYLVRFLDNINSLSNAPLPEYTESMRKKRRIGVGILGWGSALFMLKVRFGSERANGLREEVMSTIAREAYMASIDLAEEKGMFELCIPEKHAQGSFIQSLNLPKPYLEKLLTTGIRNSSLLSIQPTGNTSIFANVVSGGLEPVFMPEYIRTVIVNTMPEELEGVCPKWFEGEWYETSVFKFAKEGDEQILRGTHNGTVYKIDKNRGLTKEVLCQDYGVRYLTEKGEWDPNAEWAVTTLNLDVNDHVNDLTGFARWVDSAMSKTVNVPNNYSFEKFKNIYLDAYKSNYVKGVTTYRSGTMTTVLAAKEDTTPDEEIIKEDVQLPASAPATMKTLKAEGKKWYLTVVYHETNKRPFALFVQTNAYEKNIVAEEAVEVLIALARKKKIPKRHIDSVLEKIKADNNVNKTARLLSFLLRHGVLIKNIVAALDKVESAYAGSFVFAVKKFLSTYIKDGEPVEDAKCENCGSTNIVFSEGCSKCVSCGSSKCG
jgi:ribonucleoside-diphosphate reductase alpha chain